MVPLRKYSIVPSAEKNSLEAPAFTKYRVLVIGIQKVVIYCVVFIYIVFYNVLYSLGLPHRLLLNHSNTNEKTNSKDVLWQRRFLCFSNAVEKEVAERQNFLEEMISLGQGRKYQPIISTEISQVIQQLSIILHIGI